MLVDLPNDQGLHNGGTIEFGRDDDLYISSLGTVGVGDRTGVTPPALALSAAPNPSAGSVQLEVRLARESAVHLAIHDVRGRVVRYLEAGASLPAGVHRLAWDGRDAAGRPAAPGVYFASLDAGGETATRRILRIRG